MRCRIARTRLIPLYKQSIIQNLHFFAHSLVTDKRNRLEFQVKVFLKFLLVKKYLESNFFVFFSNKTKVVGIHLVQFSTIGCHPVPVGTIWYFRYYLVQFGTIRYHWVPLNTILYRSVPYGTIRYHPLPFNTIRYHLVPFGAIWYHSGWQGTMGYHWLPYGTIGYHWVSLGTNFVGRVRFGKGLVSLKSARRLMVTDWLTKRRLLEMLTHLKMICVHQNKQRSNQSLPSLGLPWAWHWHSSVPAFIFFYLNNSWMNYCYTNQNNVSTQKQYYIIGFWRLLSVSSSSSPNPGPILCLKENVYISLPV